MTGTRWKRSMRSDRGMRRWVGGLLVGLFVGTLLLTPAGAHINSNTKHVIKHLVKNGFLRPTRTVLVSPKSNAADSGAALLAAVTNIDNASVAAPWLVKLEPGKYNIGTQTLELPPFVSMEGSGRGNTEIRCACSSESNAVSGAGAVIHLDVSSELRSLSVLNNGTGGHVHGVDVSGTSGRARIGDVEVVVAGSAGFASGIWVGLDAQADLRDVKVQVFGTGGTNSWGVRATAGGVLDVTDSDVFVSSGDEAYGISADSSTVNVTDTSVAVQGTSDNYGVWNRESTVTYTDVTSKASNGPLNEAFHNELSPAGKPAIMRGIQALAVGGGDQYFAVRNIDAEAVIENSRLVADGVEGYGLWNRTTLAGPLHISVSNTSISAEGTIIQEGIMVDADAGLILTQVDNSEVMSVNGRYLRMNGNTHVVIGGSLLVGNEARNQGTGSLKCAGVWDGPYTFFANDCPYLV